MPMHCRRATETITAAISKSSGVLSKAISRPDQSLEFGLYQQWDPIIFAIGIHHVTAALL